MPCQQTFLTRQLRTVYHQVVWCVQENKVQYQTKTWHTPHTESISLLNTSLSLASCGFNNIVHTKLLPSVFREMSSDQHQTEG